jgi:hypothetical protein
VSVETTYDPRCADLARFFLEDAGRLTPALLHDLATDLQRAVENFIAALEDEERRERRPTDA